MRRLMLAGALLLGTLTLVAFAPSSQAAFPRWGGYGWPSYYGGYGNPYYSYNYSPYYSGSWYGGYYPSYSGYSYYPYSTYTYPYYSWYTYYPSYNTYGSYPYSGGYGYSPYNSTYTYSQPWVWGNTYSPPSSSNGTSNYAQGTPSTEYQSFYAAADRAGDRALVRVTVPSPDAQVWIENMPTQQRGFTRVFISPPLDSGTKYQYTVKAIWMEDGRQVTREKQIDVTPGREALVAFGERGRDFSTQEGPLPRTEPKAPAPQPATETARIDFAKVVSFRDGQLVVTDLDGSNRRTFEVSANAQIVVDGVPGNLDQIKPGMRVQITEQAGSPNIAARVLVTPERNGTQGELRNPTIPPPRETTPSKESTPRRDTTPPRENTPPTR